MDTNTIIRQAVEAIKQGNKSNARTLLENVIKNEPNNEEAWFLLAHVAQTQEQARTYLERVVNINPNNERAKQQLEKLYVMPSNKQPAPQPVKAKESKTVLYMLLGGIITLMLAIILLLAGIRFKNDNQPNTLVSSWEYLSVSVNCHREEPNRYLCRELVAGSENVPMNQFNSLSEYASKYGGDGWELISITKTGTTSYDIEDVVVLVFKRPTK